MSELSPGLLWEASPSISLGDDGGFSLDAVLFLE